MMKISNYKNNFQLSIDNLFMIQCMIMILSIISFSFFGFLPKDYYFTHWYILILFILSLAMLGIRTKDIKLEKKGDTNRKKQNIKKI